MKRGLTLIELVVSVAMIAVLVAILYPVFWNANAENRIRKIAAGKMQWTEGDKEYVIDILNKKGGSSAVENHGAKLIDIMGLVPPSAATPYPGGISRSLSVVLTDGRSVIATVMIPAGSEISSVSVQPVTAEVPVASSVGTD
jgi:prepilin-type N-terminal cleavage/methylation domain-containing protein